MTNRGSMRKGGRRPQSKASSKRDIRIAKRNLAEKRCEDQRRLAEQFESLPLLAYRISPTGKIVDCNSTAVKTLDYTDKRELIRKPLLTIVYAPSSRGKTGGPDAGIVKTPSGTVTTSILVG